MRHGLVLTDAVCLPPPPQVQDLQYATPATVSRCGMVWFSEDVLTTEMIFENYLSRLRHVPLEEGEEERRAAAVAAATGDKEEAVSPALQVGGRRSEVTPLPAAVPGSEPTDWIGT